MKNLLTVVSLTNHNLIAKELIGFVDNKLFSRISSNRFRCLIRLLIYHQLIVLLINLLL